MAFIELSIDKYHPNADHLQQWREAAKWFLHYASTHYRDMLIHSLRRQNYAYKTEKTYVQWVDRFMVFPRQPQCPNMPMLVAFLDHLSTQQNVAVNTQKSALNALVYCYELGNQLPEELNQNAVYPSPRSLYRGLRILAIPLCSSSWTTSNAFPTANPILKP